MGLRFIFKLKFRTLDQRGIAQVVVVVVVGLDGVQNDPKLNIKRFGETFTGLLIVTLHMRLRSRYMSL